MPWGVWWRLAVPPDVAVDLRELLLQALAALLGDGELFWGEGGGGKDEMNRLHSSAAVDPSAGHTDHRPPH